MHAFSSELPDLCHRRAIRIAPSPHHNAHFNQSPTRLNAAMLDHIPHFLRIMTDEFASLDRRSDRGDLLCVRRLLVQKSRKASDIFGNLFCLVACKQLCGGPARRIIGEIDVRNWLSFGVAHDETCGPLFGGPRWRKVSFCHLNLPSLGNKDVRAKRFLARKKTAGSHTEVHADCPQKLTRRAVNPYPAPVPQRHLPADPSGKCVSLTA